MIDRIVTGFEVAAQALEHARAAQPRRPARGRRIGQEHGDGDVSSWHGRHRWRGAPFGRARSLSLSDPSCLVGPVAICRTHVSSTPSELMSSPNLCASRNVQDVRT